MKKSIYNILKECSELKTPKERIDYLSRVQTPVVKNILKYAFDPKIKFDLPEGDPPYKPCEYLDQEGRLYSEIRKMYLFIEGGNPSLTKFKREMLFIQFIEGLDKEDAKLILAVKDKKLPFKTITSDIAKKAFPDLFNE